MRLRHTQGFTVLEFAVVIAIIGILAAIGTNSYVNANRAAKVREAAATIMGDIRNMRSEAQVRSKDMELTWQGNTYNFSELGAATKTTRTLPSDIKLECISNCGNNNIRFTAPHGELGSAVGAVLRVSHTKNTKTPKQEIRLVGVTGKPMMVAIR